MTNQDKPRWEQLALVGLVFGAGLVEETRLPFSPATDAWLLGIWVLFFYGALAIWITRNREALEREPQPLDCAGRPIFDSYIVESKESEESEGKQESPAIRPTPRAFGRSEVI